MHHNQTHGHSVGARASKTYKAWLSMRRRCLCPTCPEYYRYGGRGITVSPSWDSFEQFLLDMGEAPEDRSLDRRDNDKGYSKENCRWATAKEQGQNKRNNIILAFNGEAHCMNEWARITGIGITTLLQRLRHGWSAERTLLTSPQRRIKHG